jgi:cytochrome c1
VRRAVGNIGPPLARIGDRTFIAGMLPNTPANLIRWIRYPQSVVPGNAAPDMNLSESDARDIAAFLYTLH